MTLVQENALGWLAGLLQEAQAFEQAAQASAIDPEVAEAFAWLAQVDGDCLASLHAAASGLRPVSEGRSLSESCGGLDPEVPEAGATILARHRDAILSCAEAAFADPMSDLVRAAIKSHHAHLQHAATVARRLARRHTLQALQAPPHGRPTAPRPERTASP
ncbi:MAG TPA: hypothetical protein VFG21_06995 [Xanthomonadaceae bacterium]|nr:hypothetical protein [Xanthomonadaceae bacterium]